MKIQWKSEFLNVFFTWSYVVLYDTSLLWNYTFVKQQIGMHWIFRVQAQLTCQVLLPESREREVIYQDAFELRMSRSDVWRNNTGEDLTHVSPVEGGVAIAVTVHPLKFGGNVDRLILSLIQPFSTMMKLL